MLFAATCDRNSGAELPENKDRHIAISRILEAAQDLVKRSASGSAKLILYGAAVAAIGQIYGWDMASLAAFSPILARLVEQIGANVLTSLIDRVATDNSLSSDDIQELLEGIFEKADLYNTLSEQEFLHTIDELQKQDSTRFQFLTLQLTAISDSLQKLQEAHASDIDLNTAYSLLHSIPTNEVPELKDLPEHSRVPFARNPLFTGRKDALKELSSALLAGRNTVVMGIGGIGKTQLVTEFVHRYGYYFAGGVYWLDFSSSSRIEVEVALCGVAMGLSEHYDRLDSSEKAVLVRSAWESPLPRLVIFDNCESENLLSQWRPASGGTRVLVTTRRLTWDVSLGIQEVRLKPLNSDEGSSLLRRFQEDLDNATALKIHRELGGLPLAIHLAGSYLRRYRGVVQAETYLMELRRPTLLEHPSLQGLSASTSPTAHIMHVGRTFTLSYQRLDDIEDIDILAKALLARVGCFAPGEPVPWRILLATLLRWGEREHYELIEELRTLEALFRLAELGLVEVEQDYTVTVHPLISAFVQTVTSVEEAYLDVEAVIVEEAQSSMHLDRGIHPLIIQKHLHHLTDSNRDTSEYSKAILNCLLGTHLRMFGNSSQAASYFERALKYWEQRIGVEQPFATAEIQVIASERVQTQLEASEATKKKHAEPVIVDAYMQRGIAYTALGKLDLAEEDFNRVIVLNPRDAAGYRNRGIIYAIRGDFKYAIRDFDKAIDLNRSFALAFLNRGEAYAKIGQHKKAIADFDKALSINPRLASAYLLRGRTYLEQRNIDLAIADFSKAIDYIEQPYYILLERSNAYRLLKQYEEALLDLNAIISSGKTNANILICRAEVFHQLKRYEEALADFQRAEEMDTAYVYRILALRSRVFKDLGEYELAINSLSKAISLNSADKWAVIHRADLYRLTENYSRALSDYNKALSLDPRFTNALVGRALTFRGLRKYKKAIDDLDRALKIVDDDYWIIAQRGMLFKETGRYKRALAEFDRSLELNDADPMLHAGRAEILRLLSKLDEALAEISISLDLEPNNPYFILIRGEILDAKGDQDQALEDFNTVLQSNKHEHRALENKGNLCMERGEYKEAIRYLEKAHEIDSKCNRCLRLLAKTYQQLKRYDEALAEFSTLLQTNRKDKLAAAERGHTYYLLKRYEEALSDYELAIRIDRNYHWAHEGKGRTLLAMKRFDEAIKSLKRAEELNSNCTNCIGIRSDVYVQTKNYKEAIALLSKIIARDDQNKAFALGKRSTVYFKQRSLSHAGSDLMEAYQIDPTILKRLVVNPKAAKLVGLISKVLLR